MTLDRNTPIGFVGAGRLGASLAVALHNAGYRVVALHRRDPVAAQLVADRISDAVPATSPQEVADNADIVFITTGDAAIQGVCHGIAWKPTHAVVHCSGATPIEALSAASDSGAAIGGMHPMQTFPNPNCHDRFTGITLAIEAESSRLRGWLESVVAALGGRSIALDATGRAAYHASAVMACGLVAGLTGLAADMWKQLGLSRSEGMLALAPLIESTANQIAVMGVPAAITGPYVRGDSKTVEAHLVAVARLGDDALRGYAALALAQLPIAAEQGNISNADYATIDRTLREALNSLDNYGDE
jgi:predicted short-subunit dehydrogenase-like oxidoreductase (DUF2520 family)